MKTVQNYTTRSGGDNPVVLLVGGPGDIAREVRARLAKHGLWVRYHWEYHKATWGQKPLPKDADVVVILTDMLGHSPEGALVQKCKAQVPMIPYIRTQRKWSTMYATLQSRGLMAKYQRIGLDDRGDIEEIEVERPKTPVPVVQRVELVIQAKAQALLRLHELLGEVRHLLPKAECKAVLVTPDGFEFQPSNGH